MRARIAALTLSVFVASAFATENAVAADCSRLAGTSLTNATIVAATNVSGTVTGPDGKKYTNLPPFCSVSIVATPTSDSTINILLWMPDDWTGRFEATGNGGYAGSMGIDGPAMVYAIENGWAVASNDMGTAPSNIVDGDPLIGHPQKWIDFGYRATAVTATLSKDVIALYYGHGPRYSYFNGCSTGGQQGLMMAQRYPHLFDGILAGAPGHDRTHLHASFVWIYGQAHRTESSLVTPDQAATIQTAVVQACAKESGGLATDNFLTDPRKCSWSPAALQCAADQQANCLNADQVETAEGVYAGPKDPVTGKQVFPGVPKGSENAVLWGWYYSMNGIAPSPAEPSFDSLFKWVFGPQWQWQSFDYHNSMKSTNLMLEKILNATNPDLSRFRNRGGKLIMYHGFADPLVSPQSSIDYYTNVVTSVGQGKYSNAALRQTQTFSRLFMVPGLNHCVQGAGPNTFGNQFQVLSPGTKSTFIEPPVNNAHYHALQALSRWVEQGVAPDQIIATKYVNDTASQGIAMQRPICPYPAMPAYRGKGNPNKAANFECRVPSK